MGGSSDDIHSEKYIPDVEVCPGAAALMIVMFFVLGIVALWYTLFKDDLVVK